MVPERYAAGVPEPPDPFAAVARLEGVPSAYAAARDGIDSLLRDRGLRRSSPDLTTESLLLGAAASAALAGSRYDLEGLREGTGDPLALAVARMSTELLGLVPMWAKAPLQVLARLHTLVGAGSVPREHLGRPTDPEGARRLGSLAQSVLRPTQAPGLLVAATVHAEIVAADAFAAHNAVVARAAERIVLVSKGVDPPSVTVPEAGHRAHRDAYVPALSAYRSGGTAGVQQWLLHAAEAYAAGVEAAPSESR